MSRITHLKKQLIRYKELLANLSRKNRELFFKEAKGSTINLTKFPFAAGQVSEDVVADYSGRRFCDEDFSKLLNGAEINLHEHFLLDHVKDKDFANRLSNRLDRIRLADDKHQREFGISGAWLLGPFMCWRTSPQSPIEELLITPLFKVAVDLKRNKKRQLILHCEEDSLEFNPSLRLCLKLNLGVDLSEGLRFESSIEAINHLRSELGKNGKTISDRKASAIPKIPPRIKIIKDENGNILERKPIKLEEALTAEELEVYKSVTGKEFLLLDVMYLDQLNASRAVLISDYEGILANGLEHPILNELFNGTSLAAEPPTDRSKLKELDSYRERDNHFVVDIDSTQHRAIDKATNCRAIVIQGPPGSGKSQTIVNLIADYLAKGKKVLFVSEKRPALDVVFNRMKGADIESQAVLIHSSDLNKPELYKSFLELANLSPNAEDARVWDNVSTDLDRVKTELNQYAESLQALHKTSGLSAADLLILASETDKQLYSPEISKYFGGLDHDSISSLSLDISELQKTLARCPDFVSSPWINRHKTVIRTTGVEHALKQLIKNFDLHQSNEESLIQKFSLLAEDPRLQVDDPKWLGVPIFAQDMSHLSKLWASADGDFEVYVPTILARLREELEILKKLATVHGLIAPGADSKLVAELENYYRLPRGFADWFTAPFWSYRALRKQICVAWDGTNRIFVGHREYAESIERLRSLCGAISKGAENALPTLEAIESWILLQSEILPKFVNYISESKSCIPGAIHNKTKVSFELFLESQHDLRRLKEVCIEWTQHKATTKKDWQLTEQFISQLPVVTTTSELRNHLRRMLETVEHLAVLDRADIQFEKMAIRYDMKNMKDAILQNFAKSNNDWGQLLVASVINSWADEVISHHSQLRGFDRSKMDELAKLFNESIHNHKMGSRQAVREAFAKRWDSSESDRSGLPLLTKESSKQRKVLSPREVMEKGALTTMLQLKPCWLMSPLSISQLLPLKAGLFDVIIFDEASQVRVEDAIPSIFRASTMIVVGDDKQMPPTAFFSGAAAEDDDEEDEISPSVLDLASLVYPSVLLEWHYRSRSESLIAFSNRAFYGGRLIAAPNPQTLTAGGAFNFHPVDGGYFNSRDGNAVEANAVVSHLIQLLKKEPERSYGVIAMGVSQTEALRDALELRMTEDTAVRNLIERAFGHKDGEADAGLFIKNLENVQGDERDTILMSVGYAPSSPDKDLRLGFGPLSMKGGGRRLNVAVTRAKLAMHVFCSFSPSKIPTDEETLARNPDLCIFGRYLKYAEAVAAGNIEVATGVLNSFPVSGVITSRKASRFSKDVKRRLEQKGFQVSAEIGTSGFYIDLAIHHPIIQSSFILGIECDGAMFHSTPYARDRDKIRQNLLESRGWKILRIWSQDWSKDWETEVLRIEAQLNKLMEIQSEESEFKKASGA